ncbi:uncharacterized protein [Centruroides vittatus]|uniref:uncharacterized protein isoform X1 n=1 Tax=Centruroides vittatus TaxID=120091 RepID=UPI00350F0103
MARENSFYQDIFNYIVHGSFYPDATESKKNELLKEAIQYTVIQGNLYRTFPPACKKLRLVLSKQINQKIAICESHISNDDHLNVKETCLNVRKKYYWKNIENDVIEFIKQCPDCSEDNKSFPIKAKHQQYECLDRVWKLVEITIVGPLTYNETKVYLFRLVDVFSKWMCFHKLNSLDPKEISKILLKEFSVLGFPVGIRLVELENSEEIISLFENEIKEFIKKTKEVNKIFNNDDLTVTNDLNSGEMDLHQNEIDHSPKVNSECSNLPNSQELTNCPVEVNGDGNNNSNSSIGDNNETGDTNSNDNGDNNNNDNNSSSSNNNNTTTTIVATLMKQILHLWKKLKNKVTSNLMKSKLQK